MPLIIGTACAVGILMGNFFSGVGSKEALLSANSSKEKLEKLIDYIEYDYVDKVNTDSIVDLTISSILGDLDPHSTYIPKSAVQAVSEDLEGDFVGIGIQYFKVKDSIAVVRTVSEGPSAKAGIHAGDRLVYADEVPIFGKEIGLDSLRDLLRGQLHSTVKLKIKRPGKKELMTVNVTRDNIPLKSVEAFYMLTPKLGYVKITKFSEHTYEQFKTAIGKLKQQGAQDVVLDLRNNGGGYLKEAIKVADEFLKEGKLILFTKDNKGEIKKTFATDKGELQDAQVYVLIDQNSASASEVVAGALQDNDIGTIVGRRSFGKGLVQREMELGDGSAVRLTVARYFTPTGRSIQKPYKGENSKLYYHDFIDRFQNGELVHRDSIHVNDSLKFTTPKGKTVYGGGGIIPDVFVAKDVSYKKESLDYMLQGGMLDRFIFDYLDKDRTYYSQLSIDEFNQEVQIDAEMLKEFSTYLKEFNLDFHANKYEDLLKTYLKASMARQLFDTNAYNQTISTKDDVIKEVLELEAAVDKLETTP